MQVRTFEATDMSLALKMIKKELGPDALILSTRTIRNGKFGLLGKPMLEITAAVDPATPQEFQQGAEQTSDISRFNDKKPDTGRPGFRQVIDDDWQPASRPVAPLSSPPRQPNVSSDSDLQGEVHELKELVKGLAGQISELSRQAVPQGKALRVSGSQVQGAAVHGDHLLSLLISKGINVESARTISGFLRDSMTEEELADDQLVQAALLDSMQNLIEVAPPDLSRLDQQLRLAFVGPTGVGKTTTLAKLAASYLSGQSRSVAMITIDTYRIAAVEQLKVYGEIMHLPVDVVITPEQLEQVLDKHRDKELILIDTAGRSPRDELCIDELAAFLRPDLNIEKQLVLSATTRESELLLAIEQFGRLGISNTIFTKIDECQNLGVLFNVQIQNGTPLSWVTNGQRVPEDLLEITPRSVAELVMHQETA